MKKAGKMNNHFKKIVLTIVVAAFTITMGILWKMPFENQDKIRENLILTQTNLTRIVALQAKNEAQWEELLRRLDRIEKKIDEQNHN